MKIIVTNELLADGKISFDAELVPLNEREHDLLLSTLKERPEVRLSPVDQPHANLIALHLELAAPVIKIRRGRMQESGPSADDEAAAAS